MSASDTWEGGQFWERFGLSACPRFDGKTVLEVGCGEGNRCLEAALNGAELVVGIDPLEAQIATARSFLATSRVARSSRVTFLKGTIETLAPKKFDVIISEDALEHVMNVSGLLAEIRNRLKPGGKFYLGFGPLYHAPEGDHGWLRAVLPGRNFFPWPWGHLLLKNYAFRELSKLHGRAVAQTRDWPYLDLNQHTVAQYEEMFRNSGLRIAYIRKNHVKSLKARLFAMLGHLPILSKYCTINMFVIFEFP